MSGAQGQRVREAEADDAERIARVHVDAWRETYSGVLAESNFSVAAFERRKSFWFAYLSLDPRPGRMVVAERGGEVVGFANSGAARGPDAERGHEAVRTLHLFSIYLLARAHSRGLGQLMFDEVAGTQPAQLWVLRGNDRAIAFYKRNGFKADGVELVDPADSRIVEIRMVR